MRPIREFPVMRAMTGRSAHRWLAVVLASAVAGCAVAPPAVFRDGHGEAVGSGHAPSARAGIVSESAGRAARPFSASLPFRGPALRGVQPAGPAPGEPPARQTDATHGSRVTPLYPPPAVAANPPAVTGLNQSPDESYYAELQARRAAREEARPAIENGGGSPAWIPATEVPPGAAVRLASYQAASATPPQDWSGEPSLYGPLALAGWPDQPVQESGQVLQAVPPPARQAPPGLSQLSGHYTQPPLVTGQELFPDQLTATQQALALREQNARLQAEIQRMQSISQDLTRRLEGAHREIALLSQQRDSLEASVRSELLRNEQLQTALADARRENNALIEQSRLLVTAVEQTLDEILFNQLTPTPPAQPASGGTSRQ